MMINPTILDQIDVYYIKKLRKNNKDSVDELCEDLGISKAYLYNIENGKKNLSEFTFNKILKYYNVNYNRDIKIYEEAYNLTIKLYESYLFKNYELLKKYEFEFNSNEKKYANSRGFIFNELMLAIINLLKNNDTSLLMLEEATKYLFLYDNNIIYIYSIVYGSAINITKNLDKAKEVILRIHKDKTEYNLKSSVKGMLYYQIGKIYGCDKNPIQALRYYEEAIVYLKDTYCIERINQAKIEIAGVFLDLGLYDKAEKEYFNALEEAKKFNYIRRINACLNNLAYLYFIQKRYDECKEYVYKAKEAGSTHPDLNYYIAYIAYLKQPKKQARLVVNELLKDEEDIYTQRMLKMIQGFINDNFKNIDLYFERIKKYLEDLDDVMEIKELYKLNMAYYKENNKDRYYQLVDEYLEIIEK